jgi:hypothetical protein
MDLKKFINIDTSLSILGSLFVAFGNSFTANCLWSIGNLFLIRRNWEKDFSQATLFLVFEVIAVVGIINHLRGVY